MAENVEEATPVSNFEVENREELFPSDGSSSSSNASSSNTSSSNNSTSDTSVPLSEFEHPSEVRVYNGPVVSVTEEYGGKENAFGCVLNFKNGHSITVTEGSFQALMDGTYKIYAKKGMVTHAGGDSVTLVEGTEWIVPQGDVVHLTGNANVRHNRNLDRANKANASFFAARAGFKTNINEVNLLDMDDLFSWDITRVLKKAWKAPKNFEFMSSKADDFLTKLALMPVDMARYYAQCLVESTKEAGKILATLIEEKIDAIKTKIAHLKKFSESGTIKSQMDKALEKGDPMEFFKFVYNPAQINADKKNNDEDSSRKENVIEKGKEAAEEARADEAAAGA